MSAFLGPIHYWLYNKINLQQDLVDEIVNYGKQEGISGLDKALEEKYGSCERRPLDEVIDEGNIHGWLQDKVSRVEYKLADAVTQILKKDEVAIEALKTIFREHGKEKGRTLDGNDLGQIYKMISDSLLDGMPCDHANRLLEESENTVIWQRVNCVHAHYWETVGGEIKIYYMLRDAWLQGLISSLDVTLTKRDEGTYVLAR